MTLTIGLKKERLSPDNKTISVAKQVFVIVLTIWPYTGYGQFNSIVARNVKSNVTIKVRENTKSSPIDTINSLMQISKEIKTPPTFYYTLPLDRLVLTSSFGWRKHPITSKADFHKGVDLSARSAPVYSIMDGKITTVGYNNLLGKFIRVDHGGIQSVYGHLSSAFAYTGQIVKAGQMIGVTGSTGRATGEHLHFAIKIDSVFVHPLRFLNAL